MRPRSISYSPVTTSAAGLASAVAYANGGYALTANSAGDSLAHRITIGGIAATDHSGKTFTITGTDADGFAQTEGIAGPNGVATVTSTKYFATVSSVTVSATTGADTFNIGWNVVGYSPTYPLDWASSAAANIDTEVTGTINYTVQQTFDNVLKNGAYVGSATWAAISAGFTTQTGQVVGQASIGATAFRLVVNTVTNGATLGYKTTQPVRHY